MAQIKSNIILRREMTDDLTNCQVELFTARSGELSMKVNGVSLHSRYDPRAEAAAAAAQEMENISPGSAVILFGLGLGYLAEELLRRGAQRLIIVEPNPTIAEIAANARDLTNLKCSAELIVGRNVPRALDRLNTVVETHGGWRKVVVVKHPPSVKQNEDYFSELERLIRVRNHDNFGRLGVLVATPVYGGSLPIARYCAAALECLGHRVELLDNEIYDPVRRGLEGVTSNGRHRRQLEGLMTALMAESITAKAVDRAVDLVLLVAQSPMTAPVMKELKERRIPTAFWFVEDWRLFTYWRDWAPLYDYFFTIQRDEFHLRLKRIGVTNPQYLPLAADPQVHRPIELTDAERAEYGSLIAHVGAGYRNRRQVFTGLVDLDFKLWGDGWDKEGVLGRALQRNGARLSTEDSVKVFNATAININLHSSQFHDGVDPDGDFLNPRTFELAACGAFQLVDRRRYLPESFEVDREVVTFQHVDELPGLIQQWAREPEARAAIAARARARTLADHTYEHRMQRLLTVVSACETVPAGRCHPDHIDNLLNEADADEELKALLEQLRSQGVVKLEEAAAVILNKKAELTQTELMFLLMHEFRRWARDKELA